MAQTAGGAKLYFEPCPGFQKNMDLDCYHTYDGVTSFLREAHLFINVYPMSPGQLTPLKNWQQCGDRDH